MATNELWAGFTSLPCTPLPCCPARPLLQSLLSLLEWHKKRLALGLERVLFPPPPSLPLPNHLASTPTPSAGIHGAINILRCACAAFVSATAIGHRHRLCLRLRLRHCQLLSAPYSDGQKLTGHLLLHGKKRGRPHSYLKPKEKV